MTEQTRYTRTPDVLYRMSQMGRILIVAIMVATLPACLPTGKQSVNTELFKDKEDLKTRTSSLKPGMSKDKAFEALGISIEKFERMSLEDVQTSIYGYSQVTGTPEQLEKFRKKLMTYEGYALPYRSISRKSSLGFGTMKVHKNGPDLRIVLIFEKDRLLRAAVEGSEQMNSTEDQYLWGSLISKGIGLAF